MAQDTLATVEFPRYYRPPLDIPISLSGNYGEFRANHFHTGYDMRIGGVVGARLFAVADGFITRITVSSSGYGNGLYIEHPNGTTSLYGHLLDFAPAIQEYVRTKQYEQQSFSVDLPLFPEQFPVKKGDFVGRAGNSGASGGPHLHFELRNTETQATLNFSAYGLFPITDRTPPVLNRLQFYSFSLQSGIPRTTLLKAVDIRASSHPIPVTDTFYIAMGAYDRMEGSYASLSLSQYEVYLDDVKIYRYTKQNVPANYGRYLNSFLQYDRRVESDYSLLKTWVEPGNLMQNFVETPSQGLFILSDSLVHQIKIALTDDYGNTSTYRYRVTRQSPEKSAVFPIEGKRVIWAIDNYFETDGLTIYLPIGALGKNIDLTVERLEASSIHSSQFYAPFWRIGSPLEPLFRPMRLSIYAQVPEEFKEKALIVSMYKDSSFSAVGGEWHGTCLEANTYNFGVYTVALDTMPPLITPMFSAGADLSRAQRLSFRVSDNLSGIKSYEGFIDGEWALFEYDAKYRLLSYTFDKKRIASRKKHTLALHVTDNCNNVSIFKTDFIW